MLSSRCATRSGPARLSPDLLTASGGMLKSSRPREPQLRASSSAPSLLACSDGGRTYSAGAEGASRPRVAPHVPSGPHHAATRPSEVGAR